VLNVSSVIGVNPEQLIDFPEFGLAHPVTDFAATHRGYRRTANLPSSWVSRRFAGNFPLGCGVSDQKIAAFACSYRDVFQQV
jgi:hypothetical protein